LISISNSSLCTLNNNSYDDMPRYAKGYFYEMAIQRMLRNLKAEYSGNPLQFEEWCKHTNTGYDIKLEDGTRVECKFTLKPIFHSWFVRDWLSRDCDIIVTNNKWQISYTDRQKLRESGVKLMDTNEFLWYVSKLHRRGNKYYVFEYSISNDSSILEIDNYCIENVSYTNNYTLTIGQPCSASGHYKLYSLNTSILCLDSYYSSIDKVYKASVSTLDEGKPRCNHSSVVTSLKKGGLLESVKHGFKGFCRSVQQQVTKVYQVVIFTISRREKT